MERPNRLSIVAQRPDPTFLRLPWALPLEQWTEPLLVPLPRGLSRHVVRTVRVGEGVYAVKETTEEMARREYRLLRELQRAGLPTVRPIGVVSGRGTRDGDLLPAALITEHLRFSLPYRSLFSRFRTDAEAPPLTSLVDALVGLLVRLHLADFYWGDVSLSNVLFRRDAGGFAAYLVDAETGEWRTPLAAELRRHDVTVGTENVFAELLDLQAAEALDPSVEADEVVERMQSRYDELWAALTVGEEFSAEDLWRIDDRVEAMHELGYDVEELEMSAEGDRVRIQPRVVEAGHFRRELERLTGLEVEDGQARRLLADLAAYTAAHGLGDLDPTVAAHRWLTQVYEPIVAMVPPEARGKREPAEVFHELLVHRWYLSERAGREVPLDAVAQDFIATVLPRLGEESLTAPDGDDPEMESAADEEPGSEPPAGD